MGAAGCRSAQYWGELAVIVDQVCLVQGFRQNGELFYDNSNELTKSIFDAFAAGFNDYVRSHEERFSAEALAVDPITGIDIAIHSQFDLQLFVSQDALGRVQAGNAARNAEREAEVQRLQAEGKEVPTSHYDGINKHLETQNAEGVFDYVREMKEQFGMDMLGLGGSNAFAARREGGGGLLHINPHLMWPTSIMTFYEGHLISEADDINFYGWV